MKKITRLVVAILVIIVIATFLSVAITRRTVISVGKGFTYGPASAQVTSVTSGKFTTIYYGFPSMYKAEQTFRPAGDVFSESSVVIEPFDVSYVISNMIFWSGLMVSILAPVTILFRPKLKKQNDHKNPSQDDNEDITSDSEKVAINENNRY